MKLHFRHGWGYDAGFWTPLAAALGVPMHADDRGYFGPPCADPPSEDAPYLLVGHSFGAMRMLAEAGRACHGLVAIDGFDRFAAIADAPGVPVRVIDAMLRRCAEDPVATVAAFRARCGDGTPPPGPPTARLLDDLRRLRDGRERAPAALPLLTLDGTDDPLLTSPHRAAVFAGASRAEAMPGGGHLLPRTHAAWCARAIAAFVGGLA